MSATRERISEMIFNQPMTKRQMASRLNLSSKTVSNHLVDIHKDIHRRSNGFKNSRYVLFNSPTAPRKYAIVSGSSLPSTWRLGSQYFKRTSQTRLSSQTYPAVIFEM